MDTSKAPYVSPEFTDRKPSNAEYNGVPGNVSVDDWERMVRALYAYRLGTMSFLDMLAAWEDVLGISHPSTPEQY
ncbi:MAG TPA: hypothetical protein VFV38_21975 [Ktedonobacteraceae bacterium]|nr:hypothetical protein [Ktedonobacteraceae bacterium]